MSKKPKNVHCGGQQLPLITPDSEWTVPRLPEIGRGVRAIAIDTETRDDGLFAELGPGWATGAGYVCGVSLAWESGRVYLPVRHPETECVDRGAVRGLLADLYARRNLRLVFMNGPYDLGWIWREFDLMPPSEGGRLDDVGLMAVMVDESRPDFSLNGICRWQGMPGKDETLLREAAAAYGYHGEDIKKNLWRLPARYVGPYAEEDAVQTLEVAEPLMRVIREEATEEAYRTEADLIACCVSMRQRGLRVNTGFVEEQRDALAAQRDALIEELNRQMGGRRINGVLASLEGVRSWQWMAAACQAEGVQFPVTQPKRQKDGSVRGGGRPSFSSEWMRTADHWLPRLASQIDRLTEATDKFLGNYILNYANRGRIYPTINQFRGEDGGTRSHRFSYCDPPLQQAPGSKMEELDDIGFAIVNAFRGAFLPEDGCVWCAPDFSQQEYRMIVSDAVASKLPKADIAARRYHDDPSTDFHNLVVELTGLTRRRSKDCNFAKAFGAGIPKFALMTGMSLEEATNVMNQYDEELPFVRLLGKKCKQLADQRGYIKLIDGARIHYNLWEPAWRERDEPFHPACAWETAQRVWPDRVLRRAFTHKAMNNRIQGSAARQTKICMLHAWREGIVPIMQMHDELPVNASCERDGARMAEIMRDAVTLHVPTMVDEEYGPTWGDAKKIKAADKSVIYGATYDEARRFQKEGRWW